MRLVGLVSPAMLVCSCPAFGVGALFPTLHSGDLRGALPADPAAASAAASGHPLPAAVPCQVCGVGEAQLPHVNCANIDCNELFIACAECKAKLAGCCCEECMRAPRLLRPAKTDGGNYGARWRQGGDRLLCRDSVPLLLWAHQQADGQRS